MTTTNNVTFTMFERPIRPRVVHVCLPDNVTPTVAPGTALFLPVANTECSGLEPFPFHGDTPDERSACAQAWIDNLTNLFASVDGVQISNLAPYRVWSGDSPFTVPENNILFVPGPASGLSSADGYYLLLHPLSKGTHTIRVTGTFRDPTHPIVFPLDTTITIIVGR